MCHLQKFDRQTVQKLKYEGLFVRDLLLHIEWKDDIKENFFISLLLRMKIIAPVIKENDKEEYFMPFVLSTLLCSNEMTLFLAMDNFLDSHY